MAHSRERELFKQRWRCQAALASSQTLLPEDPAVPGKSVIKFAGALQSPTVCLWEEGQCFLSRMHLPQRAVTFLTYRTEWLLTSNTTAQTALEQVWL